MKLKSLLPLFFSMCFATVLSLTVGCGGAGEGGAGVDAGEISALETKATAGDADAAFKAGELYAQDSDNSASQLAALKWFHIAKKLGKSEATLAISTLESTSDGEVIMEAMRQADAFKVPAQ